eukprot:COSAG01_NODE_8638_length_2712_cov_1.239571_2_plen_95_part_00
METAAAAADFTIQAFSAAAMMLHGAAPPNENPSLTTHSTQSRRVAGAHHSSGVWVGAARRPSDVLVQQRLSSHPVIAETQGRVHGPAWRRRASL